MRRVPAVHVIACLTLLLLTAAAPAPAALTGIWFGKGQPDDPEIVFIDFFGANGSFIAEFRKYEGCRIVWQQVESGTWRMRGDIQVVRKTSVNGKAIDVEEEYRVESVTPTELRTRHVPTGFAFLEKRIARFEFPNCNAGV
jgi:hypothetical protein